MARFSISTGPHAQWLHLCDYVVPYTFVAIDIKHACDTTFSLKSYHNHINIWWLMLVGKSSRREQIKLFATNQKGCATICLYRLNQMNLVWRNGFGSKHVTLENLLTKSAYLVSFLNCKRRKIIPPHGVDMMHIRQNFHETFVDWRSDGDDSVIEICIFFSHPSFSNV